MSLLLLLDEAPTGIYKVQDVGKAEGTGTTQSTLVFTVPVGKDTTQGNHLVLGIVGGGSQPTGVTDSKSNVWQIDATGVDSDARVGVASVYLATALVAGDTITVTYAASTISRAFTVHEYANMHETAWVDDTAINNGATATSSSVGPVTTTDADHMLFSAMSTNGAITNVVPGNGFDLLSTAASTGTIRQVTTTQLKAGAAGNYNASNSWTTTRVWQQALVAYKPAATGPTVVSGSFSANAYIVGTGIYKIDVGVYQSSSASTSHVFTVPSGKDTRAGNRLILSIASNASNVVSVSDSRGNTWAIDGVAVDSDPRAGLASAHLTTALVAGDTITVSFGAVSNHAAFSVTEAAGIAQSNYLYGASFANGTGTSSSIGLGNPERADSLVMGVLATDGTISGLTPANSYTALPSAQSSGTVRVVSPTHFITSSITSQTVANTWTTSRVWQAVAAFYGAPSATTSGSFTADAILRRIISGTLTSDAILRKETAATFTADAILKKTTQATFTADSILRKETSASITSDAILRKETSATYTANAILRRTESVTFTADSVLRKTASATFTADAVLSSANSFTFTANAIIRRTESATFTADSVLKATYSSTATADAILHRTVSATWTADAFMHPVWGPWSETESNVVYFSFTADAILRRTESASFTADAILKRETAASFDANAVLRSTVSQTFTANAVLREEITTEVARDTFTRTVVDGWGTADAGGAWSLGSFVSATAFDVNGSAGTILVSSTGTEHRQKLEKEYTDTDVRVRVKTDKATEGDEHQFMLHARFNSLQQYYRVTVIFETSDAIRLRLDRDGPSGFSGISAATLAPGLTHAADRYFWVRLQVFGTSIKAKIWQDGTPEPTDWLVSATDSDLTGFGTVSIGAWVGPNVTNGPILFTVDDISSGGFTADAVLRRVESFIFTADAFLKAIVSATFTADAILRRIESTTFTADAVIFRTYSVTFDANAVLKRTESATFTADAVLRSTGVGTFTADAVLRRIESATFAADAVLRRTESEDFTADAIIHRIEQVTFFANAVLRSEQSGSFTADAVLHRTVEQTFEANAVLHKSQVGSFTADAILLATQAEDFTADAYLVNLVAGEGNFSADAILRRVEEFTFTADAYLISRVEEDFTADAVLRREVSETLTADAIIERVSEYQFDANAVLRGFSIVTVDANAVLRRSESGSWTADAILRVIASAQFVANAVIRRTESATFTADAELESAVEEFGGSFTADAILRAIKSQTFTANAVLLDSVESTFIANAIVRRSEAAAFTADAAIIVVTADTFTANAVLKATTTGTFTADALIVGTYTAEYVITQSVEESLQVTTYVERSMQVETDVLAQYDIIQTVEKSIVITQQVEASI